jgi:hypothetical protein
MSSTKIPGFKSSGDFSLHIEQLKQEKQFDTYTETIVYFFETQSDHEMEDIAKLLNKRIKDFLEVEAQSKGLIKDTTVKLF